MKKITDAEKARLKKLSAGKGALTNGKLSMDEQLELLGLKDRLKQSRAYSPAPMSAAAKAKAGAAGAASKKASSARKVEKLKSMGLEKTNFDKTARGPKAGTSTVSKVVKRAKTVAREARDIKTAVGSAAQALRKSPQEGMPVKKTIKNIGTQVKETARAAATGKKGTTAYKVKPDPYSKEKRKAAGGKGFVFYDVTKPKKR
jgi:hypothetical protein